MTQPNLAPAQPVAPPEDSIERVPWQLPEPGSPSHTKPHWRLVTWAKRPGADGTRPGDYNIQDVLSHERLAVVVEQPAWKHHRWFTTEVDRAIKATGWIGAEPGDGTESALARIKRLNALGKLYVDGKNVRDERGGRFRFTVYSNRFEAYDRTNGAVYVWNSGVGSWAPKESA